VKVFGAADPQGVQFRELHEPDGAEIAHELVDADGHKVDRKQVVKGFEVRSGEYVVLDDDELKAASAPKRKTVDIEHFVPREQIDPDAYDRPYYLAPQKGGDEAYARWRTTNVLAQKQFGFVMAIASVPLGDLTSEQMRTMRSPTAGRPRHRRSPAPGRKPDARARKMARSSSTGCRRGSSTGATATRTATACSTSSSARPRARRSTPSARRRPSPPTTSWPRSRPA
jgi:hypothetical protein